MNDLNFNKRARYRTKQINIVRINGVVNAHSTVQCHYYFLLNNERHIAKVCLEDSVYDFHTQGLKPLEDFIRISDSVKKEMIYSIQTNRHIDTLLNQPTIQQNWVDFKNNIHTNEFMKDANQEAVEQIIKAGDLEYNSKELLLKNSINNLFYQVLFGQHLAYHSSKFEIEEFETVSQIFPQINFRVRCNTKELRENNTQSEYEKIGKPIFVDIDKIIQLYETFYRNKVGFKFTNFLYDYEMNCTVSKQDGLVDYATININERVKNNIESQTIYELTRVEL